MKPVKYIAAFTFTIKLHFSLEFKFTALLLEQNNSYCKLSAQHISAKTIFISMTLLASSNFQLNTCVPVF